MGTRRAQAPAAFFVFLITALILSGSSALGVLAQNGGSPPLTGQVIAHGIEVGDNGRLILVLGAYGVKLILRGSIDDVAVELLALIAGVALQVAQLAQNVL